MMRTDPLDLHFFEALQFAQLEQVFLYPTSTGLSKSIFDATKTITNYFFSSNFHNYSDQVQGQEAKVNRNCKIITQSEIVLTTVSLYRPITKRGDNRFWISGIDKHCKAGDLIGLFVRDRELWVANLSMISVEQIVQTLPSKHSNEELFFSYEQVNYSIGKVIISGTFCDVPLYLDFDGSFSAAVSNYLKISPDKLSRLIFELARSKLDLETPNPYSTLTKENNAWWASGFASPPPTLLFLCCLSLAADQMSSDGEHSLNNYYARLVQLLGIKDDEVEAAVRNKFPATEKYWSNFNSWLRKNDGRFGIVTARPVIKNWKYVSIPISQALLRLGDKENIKQYLSERRLDKESEVEQADLADVLNRWLTSTAPTKYLRNLWKNKELRQFITSSAFDLLMDIEPTPERRARKRTLKVGIREVTFPIRSLQPFIFCSEKQKNETEDVHRLRGSNVFGELHFSEVDDDISILGPPQHLSLDNLLLSGIEVKNSEEKVFAFSPKKIIALKRLQSGYFVQINRPRIFEEYLIFGLDKGQLKAQATKFLDFCAAQGYRLLDNPNGLPAGFFVIDKVIFTRPVEDNQWPYDDPNYFIRPSGSLTSISVSGAVNLGRNIFHADSKPIFRFPLENEEPSSVKLFVTSGGPENEIGSELVPSFSEAVAEFKIDLWENQGENCEIRVVSSSAQFVETRLSFRNASVPKVDEPPSTFHFFQADAPTIFLGVKQGVENQQQAYFSSFNIKNTINSPRSPLADIYDKFPYKEFGSQQATLFEVEKEYSYAADNNTLDISADNLSCILGQHFFKISDESSDGNWEAICRKCGEQRYYPTQKRVRNQNDLKRRLVYSNDNLFAPTYLEQTSDTYTANTILDSVHYLQELSFQKFSEVCREVSDKPLFSFELLNAFAALGEIEIQVDERNLKPKRIFSAEPTLVKTQFGYALRGFRNAELVRKLIEELGVAPNDGQIFPRNPTETVLFELDDEFDPNNLNVTDCFGRQVNVSEDFSQTFVDQLPAFSEVYTNLPSISVIERGSLEKFDPVLLEWVSAETSYNAAAYRVNWPYRQYFITLADGKTVSSSYELAKLYAGNINKIRFQNYDEKNKSFISNLGCDLPYIVQRALVAFSGQMPLVDDFGCKIYQEVPKDFARALINRLYS